MLEVGKFVICGDWDKTPAPKNKLKIIMPPLGHVFGAGWHGSTQAALNELPNHIIKGCSFAEIGAGSGILSVAAKLLGAGKCYATELSPEAIEAARRVFKANKVDVTLIEGSFIDEEVDVAVISISTEFVHENHSFIKAKKIIAVHDDFTIEVGPPFKYKIQSA